MLLIFPEHKNDPTQLVKITCHYLISPTSTHDALSSPTLSSVSRKYIFVRRLVLSKRKRHPTFRYHIIALLSASEIGYLYRRNRSAVADGTRSSTVPRTSRSAKARFVWACVGSICVCASDCDPNGLRLHPSSSWSFSLIQHVVRSTRRRTPLLVCLINNKPAAAAKKRYVRRFF